MKFHRNQFAIILTTKNEAPGDFFLILQSYRKKKTS